MPSSARPCSRWCTWRWVRPCSAVSFAGANVLAALLVLLLSMSVMLGLGILSGAFIMAFKQGDPFTTALTPAAFLLRGVAYPVAVLPGWMQALSVVFPHTYALEPCG